MSCCHYNGTPRPAREDRSFGKIFLSERSPPFLFKTGTPYPFLEDRSFGKFFLSGRLFRFLSPRQEPLIPLGKIFLSGVSPFSREAHLPFLPDGNASSLLGRFPFSLEGILHFLSDVNPLSLLGRSFFREGPSFPLRRECLIRVGDGLLSLWKASSRSSQSGTPSYLFWEDLFLLGKSLSGRPLPISSQTGKPYPSRGMSPFRREGHRLPLVAGRNAFVALLLAFRRHGCSGS